MQLWLQGNKLKGFISMIQPKSMDIMFLTSGLKFECQWTHPIARLVLLYEAHKIQHRLRDNTHLSIPYTMTWRKSVGSTGIRTPALRSKTFHHGLRLHEGYWVNLKNSWSTVLTAEHYHFLPNNSHSNVKKLPLLMRFKIFVNRPLGPFHVYFIEWLTLFPKLIRKFFDSEKYSFMRSH